MEYGFFIARLLTSILKWLTYPIRTLGKLQDRRKRKYVPGIDDPFLNYSATKLAEMIRQRQIKSETIINLYIERIHKINPIVNAVVEDRFSEALIDAKEVDKFLSETTLTPEEISLKKPLLGVPVTIKESCAVKGLSLVVGFTFVKGTKANEDGAAVARLRNAGAIPLLVSATPELCLSIECSNLITGHTRNAYNTCHSSGGSSGGEGTLIGSGSSLIGVGSDLAGSVRIPAMFNGIYGHKPTERLVPTQGHWPNSDDKYFQNHITIGPLARYAEDLRLMMHVLSENNKINFQNKVELKDINLFYMEDIGFYVGTPAVQPEIKEAIQKVVKYLSTAFDMKVQVEKFNKLKTVADSSFTVVMAVDDRINILEDPNNPNVKHTKLGQYWKALVSKPDVSVYTLLGDSFVDANCFIPRSHTNKHREIIADLRQEMIDAFGNNGILLFPTFPTSAFRHNEIPWNMLSSCAFTLPFNALGFPSTNVPIGFDRKGLPIGIQVISAPYQDNLCLTVAEELEKQFGGWKPPL